jgi:hypothetical protein
MVHIGSKGTTCIHRSSTNGGKRDDQKSWGVEAKSGKTWKKCVQDATWNKNRTLTTDVLWPKEVPITTLCGDTSLRMQRSLTHLTWRNLILPTFCCFSEGLWLLWLTLTRPRLHLHSVLAKCDENHGRYYTLWRCPKKTRRWNHATRTWLGERLTSKKTAKVEVRRGSRHVV